jgi:hypothetical protein
MISPRSEYDASIRPAVAMKLTSFRTYPLRALGAANGAAIRVAGADRCAQRVVVKHDAAGAFVFLSSSANELNGIGGLFPAYAYALPADSVTSLVIAPDQELLAASSVAGVRLAVSVSSVVPIPPAGSVLYQPMRLATFQTKLVPIAGTGNVVQLVTSSNKPQRVVIDNPAQGALIYVGHNAAGTFHNAAPAGPIGFAFEIGPQQRVLFVTAPGQSLDAVGSIAGVRVGVQVSEISLSQVLGPSGIPGPGGEG